MNHKAGFVSIIGNPNVGKSTLMNALVGEMLSIVTSKAQTTRHRIKGIVNGENFQIIYSDTPGIIKKPAYKLHESMLNYIKAALEDSDIILYITDVNEKPEIKKEILEKLKEITTPKILAINKIDLSTQEKVTILMNQWKQVLEFKEIIPISAHYGSNLGYLFDKLIELLPESPPYYPKDELTDKPQRFFVAEIIREKIFLNYHKEIPYSTEVEIESFKESEKLVHLRANIYVTRESQKAIIIGSKGQALKKVGTQARLDIEKFLDKKVYLELNVKVRENWRNRTSILRNFGYI